MAKAKEQYRIAEYNEWVLYTDGAQFFAKDDGGNVSESANTLEALKAKLLKPVSVDVKAIILHDGSRYGNSVDRLETPHAVVRIYGVSGAGSLLFERKGGKKDKTTRYNNELRLYDEKKLREYDEIVKALAALEERKDALMADWDTLTPEEVKSLGKVQP